MSNTATPTATSTAPTAGFTLWFRKGGQHVPWEVAYRGTTEAACIDADLARLVAAWPTLPNPIRAAIRALVGTVGSL